MRVFWKIKNDNNIEEIFKYLNLPENYINRLFYIGSPFYEYLEYNKSKYFFMVYNSKDKNDKNGGFCWMSSNAFISHRKVSIDGYFYLKDNNYKYKGEVNLRKVKLEKIKVKNKWWETFFILPYEKKI